MAGHRGAHSCALPETPRLGFHALKRGPVVALTELDIHPFTRFQKITGDFAAFLIRLRLSLGVNYVFAAVFGRQTQHGAILSGLQFIASAEAAFGLLREEQHRLMEVIVGE